MNEKEYKVEETKEEYKKRVDHGRGHKKAHCYGFHAEIRTTPKIGRNEPCFCGSGVKFKKCCKK